MSSVSDEIKRLKKFKSEIASFPAKAANEAAQQIYVESFSQTPLDTGRLERSIRSVVITKKGNVEIIASASAKDPRNNYNYAGIQHENEQFRHPIKGKAFYVRDPFMENVDKMVQKIDLEFRKVLKT